MIEEAYCSFEVSKLLKEKGFDGECSGFYMLNGNGRWKYEHYHNFDISDRIDCPTHQMAMRWLREEYNIFINIDVIPYTTVTIEQRYYFYKIYRNRRPINFPPQKEDLQFYDTPEEAIEAGIKFSLENLI